MMWYLTIAGVNIKIREMEEGLSKLQVQQKLRLNCSCFCPECGAQGNLQKHSRLQDEGIRWLVLPTASTFCPVGRDKTIIT